MLRSRPRRQRILDARLQLAEALRLTRQALYAVKRSRALLEQRRPKGDPLTRNLAESYAAVELQLERVALRLETMLYTGLVTKDLLEGAVEPVRRLAEAMPPQPYLSEIITTLDDVLSSMYASALHATLPQGIHSPGTTSKEASEILRSAEVIARRRAEEIMAGEDS